YAHTREECEEKLKVLIVEMKEEIADIKSGKNPDNIPCGKSKKKAIAAYIRANPQVTNKALIARESGASRWTVTKYYEEIRRTMAAD
ncbi:MAG: site-specific integrase, partial [Christensenellaceae bacterium]